MSNQTPDMPKSSEIFKSENIPNQQASASNLPQPSIIERLRGIIQRGGNREGIKSIASGELDLSEKDILRVSVQIQGREDTKLPDSEKKKCLPT